MHVLLFFSVTKETAKQLSIKESRHDLRGKKEKKRDSAVKGPTRYKLAGPIKTGCMWGPTSTPPHTWPWPTSSWRRQGGRAKANSKFAVYERFRTHASAELVSDKLLIQSLHTTATGRDLIELLSSTYTDETSN
jgi:hypothetical protein